MYHGTDLTAGLSITGSKQRNETLRRELGWNSGHPPTLNSYAERHQYTTGEWWNDRGRYWEFCLFDSPSAVSSVILRLLWPV